MIPSNQDLNYFIAISEAGSLTAAASHLGIAQPSLTLAMQRLEMDLDVKLFERSQRGVQLTEAGHLVLAGGRAMKESWQEIKDQVHATKHKIAGRVILGCHPAVGIYALPDLVLKLQKNYPAIELCLQHDLSRTLTTAAIERIIDLGLVINPLRHPDLVIRPLLTDEVGFWIAKDLNFKNVHEHQIIADPNLIQSQALLRKISNKKNPLKPILATSQLEIVTSLTLAGAGIGILPQRVALAMGRKGLRKIPELPTYRDELCLIYRPERRERPAVRALLDLLKP